MSGLKPCLLCEGEAKLLRRSGRAGIACPSKWYRERVECKVCGLTTREYKRPGSAFRSWNNRPRKTPPPCNELETVAHRAKYKSELEHQWRYYRSTDSGFDPTKYEEQPLVTRQNAEEVIAAKDTEIERLRNLLETHRQEVPE